ncbi:hypothetical protein HPB48_012876 [Haemaphysalis longicornis]|uniref:Uncharacterized protein n=1 Tax=Haemaphysalis longicornis TaxID=44386 RepID=A0A9J6GHJ0_HAELO|nr:hypothetical protein HPB48_012876 [Haemaphysalis longicornis]
MEPVAIRRYVETRSLYDVDITVESPQAYISTTSTLFLAASADGTALEPCGTGLLEGKHPSTHKGETPEVACTDRKFCCELVGNNKEMPLLVLPGAGTTCSYRPAMVRLRSPHCSRRARL